MSATLELGTQTGSLMNHLMSAPGGATPEPGMGATILRWTDRAAATVTGWDGRILTLQLDRATRTDANGMSDAQAYTYERDPDGMTYTFKRDRKGGWRRCTLNSTTGRWIMESSPGLLLGHRATFHDYSF